MEQRRSLRRPGADIPGGLRPDHRPGTEEPDRDGCIVKDPSGWELAVKSLVDRVKLGTKRSVLTDGKGIPLGCVAAPANRHDSQLVRPTPEKL